MGVTGKLGQCAGVAALGVLASLLPVSVESAHAMVPGFPVVIDRECRDVSDNFVAKDRIAGCVDRSLVDPALTAVYGGSGLAWVDIGTSLSPSPSACIPGQVTRADGWTWTCVAKKGRAMLVRSSPWRRPAQFAFQHTSSPKRSNLIVSANVPLTGCRLTASDQRLLGSQPSSLNGLTARRVLDTSGVPAGTYGLRVTCPSARLSSSSDLLVRADGSALLRVDCLDAWHDATYGDVVPGYGRRMDASAAASTTAECSKLAPLTDDELQRAGREAYLKIGQIAERQVRRVSAAEGLPICEAIAKVFKPVDTVGRPVVTHPIAGMDITVPVAGYLPDGYFPVLNRQWSDGPVRMDNIANCASGNQSLRLAAGTWSWCTSLPLEETWADVHQMYPVYVFDRPACPSSYPTREINRNSVCITWGDKIGNNAIGGVGKVFAADAIKATANGDLTYDCQDRALRTGQFANVKVTFMPPLP